MLIQHQGSLVKMIDKIKAALWKNGSFVSKLIMYMIDSKTRETINVAKFLKRQIEDNKTLLEGIRDEQNWMRFSKDIRAIKILEYVKNRLTYKSDISKYNKFEYWANINEVIKSVDKNTDSKEEDDCEFGGYFIFALMRVSGFNENEVQLITGSVKNPYTNKIVGHCWVNYISDDYPYVNYFLDWCYYPDKTRIHKDRKPYTLKDGLILSGTKQDSKYKEYWFLITDKQGWR